MWYSRGLAEVFSNTVVRTKDVQVGMVIPWHLERLRDLPPLRLQELFSLDRKWLRSVDSDRQAHFDASAWAPVHYLTFGNQGRNLAHFNTFSTAIGAGGEATKALTDAFGGLPALESEYRIYVGKSLYTYSELDLDVKVDRAAFASVCFLSPTSMSRSRATTSRPVALWRLGRVSSRRWPRHRKAARRTRWTRCSSNATTGLTKRLPHIREPPNSAAAPTTATTAWHRSP